ncbi:hypothetical protein ACLOJK_034633 [Asimina triloba]
MDVGKKLSCGAGSLTASDGFGMGPTLLGLSAIGMDGLEACHRMALGWCWFVICLMGRWPVKILAEDDAAYKIAAGYGQMVMSRTLLASCCDLGWLPWIVCWSWKMGSVDFIKFQI